MMMDFARANEIAERIARGENGGLFQELNDMCLPYFNYLTKKFGFYSIPFENIEQCLGPDAIHRAIVDRAGSILPFSVRLCNAFRDSCRQEFRIRRVTYWQQLEEALQEKQDRDNRNLCPIGLQSRAELWRAFLDALAPHDTLSKTVVISHSQGATYAEMAVCLMVDEVQCKRVYWHDFYHIRKYFVSRYGSITKFLDERS